MRTFTRLTSLIFTLACLLLCTVALVAQKTKAGSSRLENAIIDTIARLPEVKERSAYVKKQTKGKRHLSYMIVDQPTNENPFYWVKVLEDNGGATVTHFDFHVYTKPMRIKIYDVVNDESVDLETWRKSKVGGHQ